MTDYMDYGPQLSRGFKALKVWSALQAFGVDAFRAATRRTLQLAQHLARGIQATPGLSLLTPVTLTAVCFAIDDGSPTDHAALLDTLAADNTALLGPVVVGGRHGIRACVTNHRTTPDDIDLILNRIRAITTTSPAGGTPTSVR
jgi:aromatic-L-amino-acid/L-tryptophan decarboxylase